MKVLVTGGSGYIGTHVVLSLLDAGHVVWVYDNLSTGNRSNVIDSYKFWEADVLNTDLLTRVMYMGFDAVVHLAGSKNVYESIKDPIAYYENNVCGLQSVLKAMHKAGVPKIIFSSSCAVYGNPMRDWLPIEENCPEEPVSPYGHTKKLCDDVLRTECPYLGMQYVSLRYFNAIGYGKRVNTVEIPGTNLVPKLLECAVGVRDCVGVYGKNHDTDDGYCVRDYVHVEDIARAHKLALDFDGSCILNIGSGNGYSVKNIIDVVERVTGVRSLNIKMADSNPSDPDALYADYKQAQHVLKWQPLNKNIVTAVREMWDNYRAHYEAS